MGVLVRRELRSGQVYTAHDGSGLYREILRPDMFGGVVYKTNRSEHVQRCSRKTFVEWLRIRKARKTQKYRRRSL